MQVFRYSVMSSHVDHVRRCTRATRWHRRRHSQAARSDPGNWRMQSNHTARHARTSASCRPRRRNWQADEWNHRCLTPMPGAPFLRPRQPPIRHGGPWPAAPSIFGDSSSVLLRRLLGGLWRGKFSAPPPSADGADPAAFTRDRRPQQGCDGEDGLRGTGRARWLLAPRRCRRRIAR